MPAMNTALWISLSQYFNCQAYGISFQQPLLDGSLC